MVKFSATLTVPEFTSLEIAMKLPMDIIQSVSFLAYHIRNFFAAAVYKSSHKASCNPCEGVFPYIYVKSALNLTFSVKYKRKLTLRL